MLKIKEEKAITLIVLIITIIILLILVGVAINLSLGENGILTRSKQATKEYENSVQNEQKSLDELYSSILVAEDSKVTLTMEELDEYINRKVEEKLETQISNNTSFINTDNLISTIAADSGYNNGTYSYKATTNCVIVGQIAMNNGGHVGATINDTSIGAYYSTNYGIQQVYIYLAKDDTIKFATMYGNTSMYLVAYGIK